MVNIVIVVVYIKYRLSPHECSVYPLMSVVKFDWLSRPNGFEFEKAVWYICSAWSEDHFCQVLWRLDIVVFSCSVL
jgi:hypothetical protein